MSAFQTQPEPERREPTNEELAYAEQLEQQAQAPQVSDAPPPSQELQPYAPAVPPRPMMGRWIGPSGFVPAPVFRYREGRDSPGCMVGMAIPAGLTTLFFLYGNLALSSNGASWVFLGLFASATVALVVGAMAASRRNAERDRRRGGNPD